MASHSLLFVDDETHILKALQRLFDEEDYQIYTANSGVSGLEILDNHPIDMVISDQMMPNMSGSQFLEKVCQQYPDTVRILLTGYSDMEAVISAINKGKIYQYVSKPWDNENLKITVKNALEQYDLRRENKRLYEITQQQNEELKGHNQLLEERVCQRTEELDRLYKELKTNFVEFLRVFINLMAGFDNHLGEHSKQVTFIAKLIGRKLSLDEKDMEQLEAAALLHDIGLISIPKGIQAKKMHLMSPFEQEQFKQHPVIGQTTLSSVKNLSEIGNIIRSHHEQYDGGGYPDGLKGEDIPLLARIIRVADEYSYLRQITTQNKSISHERCMYYLNRYRGNLLDPHIVDYLFLVIQDNISAPRNIKEACVSIDKLKPGMKLSRIIKAKNNAVVMQPNTILQEEEIMSLVSLKNMKALEDQIYVFDLEIIVPQIEVT